MAKAAVSCPILSCLTLCCPHEVRYAFFPLDAASLSRLLSDLEDGVTWSTETQIGFDGNIYFSPCNLFNEIYRS
jgi:hypothetical protein